MIPQHIEALNEYARRNTLITRPNLAEDEITYIDGLLRSARASVLPVTITVFNEVENEVITGYITEIDTYKKRIGIGESGAGGEGWRWVAIEDVVAAELTETFSW
ncbi:YolD-like family protein [Paenibacillus agricola]|uniref:YolD-like family protein n=1 Tax=Paenibacillus agricola TaxID=2716264 RepID=A0ABX0J460_9BACL|nr:YolD-like family protein [Paenibacillus agricola]NHN31115.1 YolD-like family protein [Paenibacillus agricola]